MGIELADNMSIISSLHVLELLSDQISVRILDAIAKDVTNSGNLIKLLNLNSQTVL